MHEFASGIFFCFAKMGKGSFISPHLISYFYKKSIMKISKDHFLKCCDKYEDWGDKHSTEHSFVFEKALARNITADNILGDEKNLELRKKNIESNAPEPTAFALERAIGKNDSVYSNFIDLLAEAKKKVGRIVIKNGVSVKGYATGFMVSKKLMLTNHHVFQNKLAVDDSVIEFNYEYDSSGFPKTSYSHRFKVDEFFYANEALDFCLVAVDELDVTKVHSLAQVGFVVLEKISGKLGEMGEELLNIIHHPGGDYKQLSIRENEYVDISSTSIMYRSDTAQGSSGSPVFNDQFQLVALHNMGIPSKNEHGQILDKYGKVIEEAEDGSIDEAMVHWKANAGIRISVIRKHLELLFPDEALIIELLNPNNPGRSSEVKEEWNADTSIPLTQTTTIENDRVNISFPAAMVTGNKNISINFSHSEQNIGRKAPENNSSNGPRIIEEESLRLERNFDYSSCKGYKTNFIGVGESIGIPKPKGALKKSMARINNSRAYILKYHKFSVIYNVDRKMPFISAINVDGDVTKRLDKSPRRDKWIRDRRIGLEHQLDHRFYSGSGFDKGHMSRREDANWGASPEEAKANADLTCVYTNACPQIPQLNRSSYAGVWGKLEKVVLEKGAELEGKGLNKITVFNGPIFKESDKLFRGVKIPMSFFKVVLWPGDDGLLKATAFILDQEHLLESINFELEDLGLDDQVAFMEYQCSLRHLEAQTGIDFSELYPYDTFGGSGAAAEILEESHLMEIFHGNGKTGA